ncbi:MAG: bifunctional (p)ppGpp synthetase/guanosine-3',5'-bis(diphosphate) 3'-pyrophosphohydrolase [Microthrixaceae bacterium]
MPGGVGRVLPWRRSQLPAETLLAPLIDAYHTTFPKASSDTIVAAYTFARDSHGPQSRLSGEPYITHPVAVATVVAQLGLDEATIVAALLHDVVEDTIVTVEEVRTRFGDEVAELVDGVTKLEKAAFDDRFDRQAETIRKLMVVAATDMRVLVVKLADRLHNMRTLAAMPTETQERIATETMEVYAPLATRLGMTLLKQQLEDMSFAALHPRMYAEIDHMVAMRDPERELFLYPVEAEVGQRLKEAGIEATVTGRPKHLFSIYEKMQLKGRPFDTIYDLVGIRVVVETEKDCYAALGTIHSMWTPVPGRFKDFIATWKDNLYQSLHTTVVGPHKRAVEVQIRTKEMDQRAESGVAAHFAYKAQSGRGSSGDATLIDRVADWQREFLDPREFLANLKRDLTEEEIVVRTPKGDMVHLPKGATPVDFAYAIHTELGHRCNGARADGVLVPLEAPLAPGVTVEIVTSTLEGDKPSEKWLETAVSRAAQRGIRQFYSRERRNDAVERGRAELERAVAALPALRSRSIDDDDLDALAGHHGYDSAEAMYNAIAAGHLNADTAAESLATEIRRTIARGRGTVSASNRTVIGTDVGVLVEMDADDRMEVRIAGCCTPAPPDDIIAFVTRGRGVSVHRSDCETGVSLAQEHRERLVDVEWDPEASWFKVRAVVMAVDRPRLLADVTSALADQQVNIVSASTRTEDTVTHMEFEFRLADVAHLEAILSRVRNIENVFHAERI